MMSDTTINKQTPTRASIYVIEGFSVGQYLPNRSGFSIAVHKDFVRQVLAEQRPEENNLIEIMHAETIRAFGESQAKYHQPKFYEDTWMLTKLSVPGNAAYLSLDGYQLTELQNLRHNPEAVCRHFKFEPHNLDSLTQAACLLAQWLIWFNTLTAVTRFEFPSRAG